MADLLPHIVKLEFGTEKHRKVLEYVMARVRQGRSRPGSREQKWSEAEDLFSAYVKETEIDSRRRSVRDNDGVPQYINVTIPYAYATLMTAHTYWTSVFLSRDPILQVQGMNNEAQTSEQAVEAMLQYFIIAGKNLVPYFIWLLDQGKYGEGIIGMCWDVDKYYIPEVRLQPRTVFGVAIPGTMEKVWTSKEVVGYEGLRLFNVRPHDFLFDPTVTLQNFQRGEFAGHEAFVPILKIRDGEAMGRYYNADKVQARAISSRAQRGRQGNDVNLPDDNMPRSPVVGDNAMGGCDLTEITIELCPKDLGLANRDYLEKWSFTVANDTVIVSAQPQGWYHNEFMYDTLEHEIEGYNVSKRGMMEMLHPLNKTLDWLINTHFFNVRKSLNNEFIYDPSILVSKDVESPGPGKLIRVRPDAFGKDIRSAFAQLPVTDITQNHVRDSMMIVEMMQRLTGVNDTVMGMVNKSRKTATEVRSSSSFAVNRLKTQCEYYSAMGFAPHTSRAIKVAQQMFQGREGRFFRIVGNRAEVQGPPFIKVGPAEIAGQYDFMPVDGTMPVDRSAMAAIFGQTLQQMAQIPPVAQGYDWVRLFGYFAELNGIRNLQRFRINVLPPGVMPGSDMVPAGSLPQPNMVNNGAGIPPEGVQQ